jgi:mono/diheme cytochrome c family protein
MLLMALLSLFLAPALAQEEPIEEIGKQEFIRSCAACHGESGKGDGLVAGLLLVKPPDLTSIRKRHDGEFPASWVYRIIDGRNEMRPHGSREMPIWGDRYRAEALQGLPLPLNVGADAVVHGRILSLVFYLDFIQE